MSFAENIILRALFFVILGTISFFLLLGTCGILRLIHISVNWVTWIIGSLLILDSVLLYLSFLLPQLLPFRATGSLLAGLSFLIAVYAAGQWLARQGYIQIKKHSKSRLVKWAKNALLYLRQHHEFFGWIVAFTALAHTIFFLPYLTAIREYELVTGFIALGILAISVILGLWMWLQQQMKKVIPKTLHNTHALLTIAFFIALFMHM